VTELRADSGGDFAARLQGLARSEGRPRVEVAIDPGVGALPSEVALALTRVAQEVVTNATKHSKAATLKLTLRAGDTAWTFEGRDDGVGTDTLRSGHGLSGMRERIEGIGGTLSIDTHVGRGFAVTATVPRTTQA
jgi:signal transduction histidine kinase